MRIHEGGIGKTLDGREVNILWDRDFQFEDIHFTTLKGKAQQQDTIINFTLNIISMEVVFTSIDIKYACSIEDLKIYEKWIKESYYGDVRKFYTNNFKKE